MTPDEAKEFCEWIHQPTIDTTDPIKEAYLTQETPHTHTANAAAGYIPKAAPELITYLHAAAGYPIKKTWIKAIQQGHYIGWPGLTADRVQKYLTNTQD